MKSAPRKIACLVGTLCLAFAVTCFARPSGTQATDLVDENCIVFFKDSDFRNTSDVGKIRPVTAQEQGRTIQVPQGYGDNVSSLKWNLPSGVIVILYKDEGGKSRQYVVFGKGQDGDLKDNDIADAITSWSWYRVGQ